MKHIIEKTEAVMKIGSFTIGDFSKGISDLCNCFFPPKNFKKIFEGK